MIQDLANVNVVLPAKVEIAIVAETGIFVTQAVNVAFAMVEVLLLTYAINALVPVYARQVMPEIVVRVAHKATLVFRNVKHVDVLSRDLLWRTVTRKDSVRANRTTPDSSATAVSPVTIVTQAALRVIVTDKARWVPTVTRRTGNVGAGTASLGRSVISANPDFTVSPTAKSAVVIQRE